LQQLVAAFTNSFVNGDRFETITKARSLAESILNEKIAPGTPAAKLVDESVEQGLIQAARQIVKDSSDPLQAWEQCLDLYDRQPGLNTRTSTSILQQAYSTPIPIAYLAGKLALIDRETTVYEPTAGNGALLLLANPGKAIVNELNPNRAAALRAQGFSVTQQDASTFLPAVEAVDRIITNPPFGSLKDAQGLTQTFRRGLLTTSQLDHAIALTALELMKPQGRAVLILGGKMGDERSRTERYNTQLTRGFYRWLYKDAGYKVADHFSIAGKLYSKQGTSFPIDVILIEGKGETQLKLPGVEPPRIYSNYETLKEVLVYATEQQFVQPRRDTGITLSGVRAGETLDTNIFNSSRRRSTFNVDDSVSAILPQRDRDSGRVSSLANSENRVPDRTSNSTVVDGVRTPEREKSGGLGGEANQRVPTSLFEQSDWEPESASNGDLPSEELSGIKTAMSFDTPYVSGGSTSSARGELELSRRYEFNRLVDVDEFGHEPSLFSGLSNMAEPNQLLEVNSESFEEQSLENQVAYKPRSQAFSLSTLAPAASLKGLENAFNKIEAATGMSVDEYVQDRLNETTQAELFSHYAAEQIDSLALSIYNYEFENKATLIGHDTGIGKTRIICGLARYAQQQGMIPIIVTADSVLYADILARDAVDTGNSFNPLITNKGLKLNLTDSNGEVIGEISTPKTQAEKVRQCAQSSSIGEHDCIFTTYGQLSGPASVERRQLLSALAPRSFLILDESHKAGGASADSRLERKTNQAVPSCSDFFQELVTQTRGFVASSATAIKDPIIASRLFYETTDLKLAAPSQDKFTDHLKAGGVPLQQQVFAMWAESGGCIRCEKSYEGVEFGVAKVPVSLQTAENNSKILNLIWQFDKAKEAAVKEISAQYADAGEAARNNNLALGEAGAESTNFTSVLHNLTAVTSLGLKAEATASSAIADIEQGRKPILMLFNTLESTVREFVDTHNELADAHNAEFPDRPMRRIEVGDDITIDAGQLFTRYLEKARTIKITEPYLNELTGKNQTRSHRLTDEELGDAGVATFNRAEAAIATADWTKLPISPIDYIKQKIEDAGYSIGEITGRTHILKYEGAADLASGVVTYSTRKSGTAQKKQVMDDFQNGRLDAIITNSTTGYSLHAARTVADQRQRIMYLVQPHLDINQVEQSIGRSHRSGQLDPELHAPDRLDDNGQPVWGQHPGTFGLPVFKLVVGQDLPTEERAVAILMKKMSYLKANTTGNKSSSFGLIEMPDFINAYGNEVAQNLMEQNPELHADLDYPLGYGEELSNSKAIQIVTGRAVMLTSDTPPTPAQPYPSLARQAWLYDTLTIEYQEFLAQKIALGENELEAQKLDLQAEPKARIVLSSGDPQVDSPFTKPAYLVEVEAKTGAKPNTTEQVVNAVRQELGFETTSDPDNYNLSEVREVGQQVAQDTVEELRASTSEFLQAVTAVKEAEIALATARVEKYQLKLDAGVTNYSNLEQQRNAAAKFGNTEVFDKLTTQLGQQQPKIDKLKSQLSKAKLDVNGKQFQLNKEQRIINATLEEVCALINQFPVGQPVRLMDNETKNYLYGVVVGVEQKSRANNPATPGNWKLKLLVVDGVRSLSVKFDSLTKNKQTLGIVETVPSFTDIKTESSVYQLFDQRQSEAKERRYLVSGQVLATELTGKFAQVSDHEGQVHPVYLLRRGFDPAQDMDIKPVMLANQGQVKQFFEKTERLGVVKTPDENLTVIADISRANAGGIVIKTPKATAQGGLYFKDDGLLELVGDFVSKTESVREGNNTKSQSIMAVTVEAQKADAVISYISQKWGLGAASHKNVARALLGQVLPSWEPCNAINPDVERIIVPRASQIQASPRNDLERVFDASSASKDSAKGDLQSVKSNIPYSNSIKSRADSEPGERTSPSSTTFLEPNSIPIPPAATTTIPLEVHNTQLSKQIAAADFQHGGAERNVAKLLHQAGLAAEILIGEDFYLKVENQPYIPLSIERHGPELYLTHFLKDSSGDLFIDAEMVFQISPIGQLSLTQTAVQNPLTGGEYRRNDKQLGKTFSKNLLEQGFAPAALSANLAYKQLQSVQVESPRPEQDLKPLAATVQTLDIPQAEQLDAEKTKVIHLDSEHLLKLEPISHPPKSKSTVTKTKHAKIPSPQTRQLKESIGVQLSLFDAGLGLLKTELEPVPQTSTRVKDVSPYIEESENIETSIAVSSASEQPKTSSPARNVVPDAAEPRGDSKSTPMQIFQQIVDVVDKRTGEFLAGLQSSSPSVDTLRDWYRAARLLGKAQNYLNRIGEVANDFKQGQPLEDKAIAVMQADLQADHKHLTTIEQVNQLNDQDFLLLHQGVADYFTSAPPTPPTVIARQSVQDEVKQLQAQINQLWKFQADQVSLVESMQKNPFRIWNGKYDAAISQVQATTGLISQSITQKDKKEQQLQQWTTQEDVYQAWSNSPQTSQMRSLASVLNSPSMQERLANINQQRQQQKQVQLSQPGVNHKQQQGDYGKERSL
jgi:hypothetical protein